METYFPLRKAPFAVFVSSFIVKMPSDSDRKAATAASALVFMAVAKLAVVSDISSSSSSVAF